MKTNVYDNTYAQICMKLPAWFAGEIWTLLRALISTQNIHMLNRKYNLPGVHAVNRKGTANTQSKTGMVWYHMLDCKATQKQVSKQ